MTNPHNVQPDQVWADNDPRSKGRTLTILAVDNTHAIAEVRTDIDPEFRWSGYKPKVGTTTRIRLDRFKPTSTGYRLEDPA